MKEAYLPKNESQKLPEELKEDEFGNKWKRVGREALDEFVLCGEKIVPFIPKDVYLPEGYAPEKIVLSKDLSPEKEDTFVFFNEGQPLKLFKIIDKKYDPNPVVQINPATGEEKAEREYPKLPKFNFVSLVVKKKGEKEIEEAKTEKEAVLAEEKTKVATVLKSKFQLPVEKKKEETENFVKAWNLSFGDCFVRKGEEDVVYEVRKLFPHSHLEAYPVDPNTSNLARNGRGVNVSWEDLVRKIDIEKEMMKIPREFSEKYFVKGESFRAENLSPHQCFLLKRESEEGKVFLFDSVRSDQKSVCGIGYQVDLLSGEIRKKEWVAINRKDIVAEVVPFWEIPKGWVGIDGSNSLEEIGEGEYFLIREEDKVFKAVGKTKKECLAVLAEDASGVLPETGKSFILPLSQLAARVARKV